MKSIDKYLMSRQIGQGQYGKVYEAINNITHEVFAIKVIKLARFKQIPKLTQFIMNEVETLKKIHNPNIIRLIDVFNSKNNLYLVYEFCNGGNLEEHIQKQGLLREQEVIEKLSQLLNAFETLVKESILHRDLKPSNILLHNSLIKVADFGFCKTLEYGDLTQTMVGSPIYMAPEILLGEPYSLTADIWSLGVCLYEMLFGRCPYEDVTIQRLIQQINTAHLYFPRELNPISDNMERLLRRMLVMSPQHRITWEELFSLRKPAPQPLPSSRSRSPHTSSVSNQQSLPPPPRSPLTQQRNVSPIRQASSPYQQVFQKKTSQQQQQLQQNFVSVNLRHIQTLRNRQLDRVHLIIKMLEQHESQHMPQIVLFLVRQLQQEMQFDSSQFLKWSQFRQTPFFERCLQLQKEDMKQVFALSSQSARSAGSLNHPGAGQIASSWDERRRSGGFDAGAVRHKQPAVSTVFSGAPQRAAVQGLSATTTTTGPGLITLINFSMDANNPLDFKINIEPAKLDHHIEPDADITVDKYDSVYQHHEEEAENPQKELIIEDYDLREAAHPMACVALLFATIAPCVLFLLSNDLLFTYCATFGLQLGQFLYAKNYSGPMLVKLRWSFTKDWQFQSEQESQSNKVDRAFFWTCLLYGCGFWLVMGLFARIIWIPLTLACLGVSLLNHYGFYKCRGAHQQKLQKLKREVARQGMNIVGMILK